MQPIYMHSCTVLHNMLYNHMWSIVTYMYTLVVCCHHYQPRFLFIAARTEPGPPLNASLEKTPAKMLVVSSGTCMHLASGCSGVRPHFLRNNYGTRLTQLHREESTHRSSAARAAAAGGSRFPQRMSLCLA